MDNNSSPLQLAKELERQVLTIFSDVDIDTLPGNAKINVARIKQDLVGARLDIRDYEFAESATEQTKSATAAQKRLKDTHALIVKISEYNIFAAADVAQLGAQIEQIIERME